MAKPMKTLELHYPMIQFLIKFINQFSHRGEIESITEQTHGNVEFIC